MGEMHDLTRAPNDPVGPATHRRVGWLRPRRPEQPDTRRQQRRPTYHVLIGLVLLFVVLERAVASWPTVPIAVAAAPSSHVSNPTIPTPSWLQSATSQPKVPDLGQYVSHPQPDTNGVHAWPVSMKPARMTLTTSAQHFVSSDNQLEVDVPTGSLDSTQLSRAGGSISLAITQVRPGSGGLDSEHVFFGTYTFQFFDAHGKALSGVQLHHPFTLHYHLSKDQQLVWSGQKVYALWNAVQGSSTMPALTAQAQVMPQAASASQSPTVQYAQADAGQSTWSVQSTFSAPSPTGAATSNARTTSVTTPALQASSVTFGTQAPQATWGKPSDFQVGLSSGSLNYSYPLSVPAGPGGLAPSLALTYSSASVNENHNVQATAPWVGQGWNLDLGSISWAQENVLPNNSSPTLESVWHFNDPSGVSGQLIPPDLTYATSGTLNPSLSNLPSVSNLQSTSNIYIWQTAPDSHAKVREVAFGNYPCWEVYFPNGITEQYGCTNDSREAYKDSNGNWNSYAWNPNLIIDRYGNQIHISYWQIVTNTEARDAVPEDITYDDPSCHNTTTACSTWNPRVDIHFDASQTVANLLNSGCGTGGNQYRCDAPQDLSSSGGLPVPKVLSSYVLNDAKIEVGGNILHEYVFSYTQSGPQTITDPSTGLQESTAGYLNLMQIQELGTNGTALNAPIVTMQYVHLWEHYSDLFSYATPSTNCSSEPGAPRDGSSTGPCYLWSQSQQSYYLSSLNNGEGWQEGITWKEAHSNVHGVDSGAVNDAWTCTGQESYTNICSKDDDKTWSRVIVAGRTETTNGVTSTWTYNHYYLQTGLGATFPGNWSGTCSQCSQGYSWGNQNDDDYADYYNGTFEGFSQVVLTQPDNSTQTDTFGSTNGWGLYSSAITCFLPSGSSCSVAPFNGNTGPVTSGRQTQEQDYDSSGNLLKQINWSWATNCPPQGVAGSSNAIGGSTDPGGGFLFSFMDHNNPVMVCDPRVTQENTYLTDGVTSNISDARVIHQTTNDTYDGNTCGAQGYDYGNVTKQDVTANDIGGAHVVSVAQFCPNDNIGAGVFLTDLPEQTQTQDGLGTQYGCTLTYYGGASSPTTAPNLPDVTRTDARTSYNTGCSGGSVVTTLHSYDASGNVITATDPDDHLGCTNGSSQYSACATYDSTATQLLTATNAKNQMATNTYDQAAAQAGYGTWLMSTTNINGQTTSYEYDALGRLTAIIAPGDSVSYPTVTYTYTNTCTSTGTSPCLEMDTTTRVTSGTTTTTKQWYDGAGRVIETQTPGPNLFSRVPAIPSALVTYTIYDNMGRATTQSLPYAIAATAGTASNHGYVTPDLNQPRTVTSYDSLGRSKGKVTYGTGSTIVSSSTITYTIAQGVTSFNLDTSTPFERTTTLDAYVHQQMSYADGLGRNRYSQSFSGTSSPYTVVRTIQSTYDVVGNRLATNTFDATSTQLTFHTATYDGLKRVIGWNDADAGACTDTPLPADCSNSADVAWKASFDNDGNLLSQTDPRNVTTYTSYDALDRPLCSGTSSSAVNPCQSSAYALYFYDSYTNGSNPGVTFPTGCTAPSGTSSPVGTKVAEVFSNAVSSGWRCSGYDARGQQVKSALSVTADSQTTTQAATLSYNDAGNATSLTYPDGEVVNAIYDSNDFLRGMTTTNGNLVSAVQYTNAGEVAGMTLGGETYQGTATTPVQVSLGYDSIQRPTSDSVAVGGTTLFSQNQIYDNVGNVLHVSTTLPSSSGGSKTDTQSFCYDALSRLVWAGNSGTPTGGDHCGATPTGTTIPTYQQAFNYDAMDRLTSGSSGTLTYGDASHTHAATGLSSIPNQYASYDAMGNMTCRNTDTSGSQSCAAGTQTGATMSYDNEGRLTSWTAPSGTTASDQFLYDNEGNRVLQRSSTTASGTTTVADTITFDGLTDTVITNGVATTTKYYSVGGKPVAEVTGSTWSYLLPDLLSSTVLALNGNGTLQAVQLFAPYGTVRYSDGSMPTPHNFTGQRLDALTALLYYNARYYDSVSARFISADSVQGNAQGRDPYAYVGGNPETMTDPTGNYPCVDPENCEGPPHPSPSPSPTPPPSSPTPPPPSPTPPPGGDGNGASYCGGGTHWNGSQCIPNPDNTQAKNDARQKALSKQVFAGVALIVSGGIIVVLADAYVLIKGIKDADIPTIVAVLGDALSILSEAASALSYVSQTFSTIAYGLVAALHYALGIANGLLTAYNFMKAGWNWALGVVTTGLQLLKIPVEGVPGVLFDIASKFLGKAIVTGARAAGQALMGAGNTMIADVAYQQSMNIDDWCAHDGGGVCPTA